MSDGAPVEGDGERRFEDGDALSSTTGGAVPVEIKAIVLAVVVLGLVLRFVTRSPLWLDEALSVNIARLPIADIPEALRHDGHPPLYYVLLHGWMQVAGTSDAAVRALSGVLSVVTLPVAFLVGRRRGGPVLGWICLGVFAMSPFVLRYATETRMYALITLLVLIGYLVLDDMVRRDRDGWGRVAAVALLTAALLYTHYWDLWLLVAVGGLLAVTWKRRAPAARRGVSRAILGMGIGAALFVPWLPTLFWQSRHTGTPWSGPLRPASVLGSTLTDFGGGNFKDAQFVGAVLLVLVLLAVFGRSVDRNRIEIDLRTTPQFRAEAAVLSATILLGLLVSYATWSAFVTRYASVFLPLVLLLVAGGITRFPHRWVRSAACVVVLGLLSFGAVYNLTKPRTQAGPIAAKVAEKARPDDVVVYCPDQLGPAALRVMPAGLRHAGYPTLESPERIDWVDYATRNQVSSADYARQLLERAGPDHGLFLVWSGGYETHVGTCEALLDELARARPGPQTLLSEDGDTYFEHANLTWFPGA